MRPGVRERKYAAMMIRRSSISVLAAATVAFSASEAAPAANAKPRWCGTLHGGKVMIVRGAVRCATARRVLGYALTHVSGNRPAPRGWECFRISGVRAYNGDECIAPPGAEAHPPKRIQVRFRR